MGEQQLGGTVTDQGRRAEFDPSRHLTRLSRRQRTPDGQWRNVEMDYLEVKWRLLWLRAEQPEARIETQLVKHEPNFAVFSARVTLPSGAEATGWGSETADDWRDYIEKAETKALGRALAALGFGTQFCEDFDFAQGREEKVVDAPVDLSAARGAAPRRVAAPDAGQRQFPGGFPAAVGSTEGQGARRDGPATEPQVKAIYAIARGSHAMDDGTLEEHCRNRFGCVPAELTRRQASEFIDSLKLGVAS